MHYTHIMLGVNGHFNGDSSPSLFVVELVLITIIEKNNINKNKVSMCNKQNISV